ncbi:hypothetical protein [Pseudoclavibacter sp. VKM Ac-2867]|nr:hypothetical protein [Pseudoclavibacter sp. VKM Ac-2867]MBF4457315.1 hypothetical protein [Pseudoclavibacter sp. VKM Ac-2867]
MSELGERRLTEEIKRDARAENRLYLQATLALVGVAVLVLVREVFFL